MLSYFINYKWYEIYSKRKYHFYKPKIITLEWQLIEIKQRIERLGYKIESGLKVLDKVNLEIKDIKNGYGY